MELIEMWTRNRGKQHKEGTKGGNKMNQQKSHLMFQSMGLNKLGELKVDSKMKMRMTLISHMQHSESETKSS